MCNWYCKSRKSPNEEERVPPHILWMNKFTILAYRPFIPDPPGDMTVLRYWRPCSVPSPGLWRILFHVPRLPGVFLLFLRNSPCRVTNAVLSISAVSCQYLEYNSKVLKYCEPQRDREYHLSGVMDRHLCESPR